MTERRSEDRILGISVAAVGAIPVVHQVVAGGAWGASPTIGLVMIVLGALALRGRA